jgi:hypothetical protein
MIGAVRARELFELGEHQAALEAVRVAIDQYRADHWFELLGHTVEFAARASYEMRDAPTLIKCLLEMSSSGAARLPEPTREWAHAGLVALLTGKPPAPPKGTTQNDAAWAEALAQNGVSCWVTRRLLDASAGTTHHSWVISLRIGLVVE